LPGEWDDTANADATGKNEFLTGKEHGFERVF